MEYTSRLSGCVDKAYKLAKTLQNETTSLVSTWMFTFKYDNYASFIYLIYINIFYFSNRKGFDQGERSLIAICQSLLTDLDIDI